MLSHFLLVEIGLLLQATWLLTARHGELSSRLASARCPFKSISFVVLCTDYISGADVDRRKIT